MNVEEICRDKKLRLHHPDFLPELKENVSTLPDDDRRNLREEFRDCIIAYLVKNMNFDKSLLKSILFLTLVSATIDSSQTACLMLQELLTNLHQRN